jgi:hypothetical protein
MAFVLQNWGRVSVTANTSSPSEFSYNGGADTQSTIGTANYFSSVANECQVGDVIYSLAADSSVLYTVTAVNTAVNPATISVSQFAATGTVGTSNITNLAVTTAKIAANAVTSAQLDPTTLQYATGTISAAAFNGANASPVSLVTAPGANKLAVVRHYVLELAYGTTPFAAGGAVGLQYGTTAALAGPAASSTIPAASFTGASASSVMGAGGSLPVATVANTVNKAITLSNGTAAFTTGDSTFNYYIWYNVVSTT